MSSVTALLVAVGLLAANAFFVGAEFAVLSSRRSRVEPLVAAGSRRARITLWAMEHATRMLACAQLGITVCSVGLGAVAEPAIARTLEAPMLWLGLPEATTHVVGFLLALLIVVYLHVLLGEMVPKNLAVTSPEKVALWLAPPLVLIARIFAPLVNALNWLANLFLRAFGVEPRDEVISAFTAEEVAGIIERSQAEGVLRDDLGLLRGVLEFSTKDAAAVMVSGTDLITLPAGCTPNDVERAVAQTGFSRFPVRDPDGDLRGYLHVKDVLYAEGEQRDAPVPWWRMRDLGTVSGDEEIEEVLRTMQHSGIHVAAVRDSQDGPARGIVFLEDILEELVGEVSDTMQRHGMGRAA